MSKIDLKSFWNNCHENNISYYLSGYSLSAITDFLKIEHHINSGNNCLNIGVGLGYCTESLVEAGMHVSVLDISPVAIERVRGIIQNGYDPSELSLIPKNYYHIIISHLVTQHMSNASLAWQLKYCVRALVEDGVYAMQFAFSPNKNFENDENLTEEIMVGGRVCRSLKFMSSLVKQANGKIVNVCGPQFYDSWQMGWWGIHIKKKESGDFQITQEEIRRYSGLEKSFLKK